MPYVSKDDIMAYIPAGISLQQGVSNTVEISLFKDYLDNHLNAADADSIVVTLYNSLGQKTYQYANPVVPGQTDRLNLGAPASATQGIVSFDITATQAANLASGDVYAQVTITYSNYYPRAKTYVLPQLLIGDNNGSSIPGGTGTSGTGTGGSGSGGGSSSNDVVGVLPYVKYNVSHVDGSTPDIKSISLNSDNPTLVTEIIFYNLDQNNHRNVYLENFLENRTANGVSGTITLVDANNAKAYSIYNISSYSRINAESGGGDDNDNDYTKIVVTYEDNSYTPIEAPYKWVVGDTISYTLDAFGGAGSGSGPTQPGIEGAQGAQGADGVDGVDGLPGRDGDNGTQGAQGAIGAQGASGVDGIDGAVGTQGAIGAQGANCVDGAQGANGVDGAQGANGVDGAQGANGVDGAQGAAGIAGAQGANGVNGAQGAAGIAGAQGATGTPGTGITFQGSVANVAGLPTTGNDQGDAYLNQDNDSLWIWDGTQWVDGGSIQGPAGPAGPQGAQGADGAAASAGAQGATGAQGADGSTGAQGAAGIAGPVGPQGTQGDAGINGAQGADGANGAQGANGETGPAGPQGAQGDAGVNGAQGAAGINGAQGADGANGAQGANGETGPAGPQGAQGAAGIAGAQGANGVDGAQGAAGIAGAQGANGVDGAQGAAGIAGAQGAAGPEGPTGAQGATGAQGVDGVGIPSGGTSGQVLTKVDSSLYNVSWSDPTGASGSGYTKYLLRLNYDINEQLIAGASSHSFASKSGYQTTGASIDAVTGGATGSISVSFDNENNPPVGVLVMAFNPVDATYKVHHYDKDAANTIINTSRSNFNSIGSSQFEPDFFGNFSVGMTLDTRLDFIKIGDAYTFSPGFPNPDVVYLPHAYVIFVF